MNKFELIDELAQILIDENSMDLFDIVVQGLESWGNTDLQGLAEEYALELTVDI
tara:strand:- start:242 stop:403 length:162 start_codon:yes stop_codon:yes gene_type:complete